MSFIALGINHKTASLELRERISFASETLGEALAHATQACQSAHIIILSTCNRTEIYSLETSFEALLGWMSDYHGVQVSELERHAYHYIGSEAVQHAIRVASGLDSMIIGEPQIFGQIKQALVSAQAAGTASKQLVWLFAQIVAAAKKVRSQSRVGEQAVSLGFAVAKLTEQIFTNPKQATLLLVGAGEMNRLVAEHLCKLGVKRIIICNRTLANADALAAHLEQTFSNLICLQTQTLGTLESQLTYADVLCSCTASMQPLIQPYMIKQAIRQRRYKPMLLVDLAVPRDICADVARIDDVYHYAVDDLQHVVEGNLNKRRTAAVNAEVLVSQLTLGIEERRRIKEIGHDIKVFQAQAEALRSTLLMHAQKQIEQGVCPQDVLTIFSKKLTAKLAHSQFKLLREVAHVEDPSLQKRMIDTLHDSLSGRQ